MRSCFVVLIEICCLLCQNSALRAVIQQGKSGDFPLAGVATKFSALKEVQEVLAGQNIGSGAMMFSLTK